MRDQYQRLSHTQKVKYCEAIRAGKWEKMEKDRKRKKFNFLTATSFKELIK